MHCSVRFKVYLLTQHGLEGVCSMLMSAELAARKMQDSRHTQGCKRLVQCVVSIPAPSAAPEECVQHADVC